MEESKLGRTGLNVSRMCPIGDAQTGALLIDHSAHYKNTSCRAGSRIVVLIDERSC